MSCNSCGDLCSEYPGAGPNGPSCSYATLNSYNGGSNAMANSFALMNPPRNSQAQLQAQGFDASCCSYVVPAWAYRPTYDSLQMGSGCGGYASIISAYGVGAENCCPKYTISNVADIPCRPCAADTAPCQCDPNMSAPQYMPKPRCGDKY